MTKLNKKILIGLSLTASLLFFGVNDKKKKNPQPEAPSIEHVESLQENNVEISTLDENRTPVQKNKTVPKKIVEEKIETVFTSVSDMFKDFKKSNSQKNDLLGFIKTTDQKPQLYISEIEKIKTLSIVRTANTLTGIKYVHTQFTGDSDEREVLKHLSFEISPSKTAFDNAKQILKLSLPDLGEPTLDKIKSIASYKYGDYAIWIKKLNEDDLKSDLFKPRTSEDIGTVQVTIELDRNTQYAKNDQRVLYK